MKKIFTLLALVMFSAMSWAAIGAPTSIDFGTYNIYNLEEVTDSLEISLNPTDISDWGIGVEIVNDAEGVFSVSDSWLYENGTPDYYGVEKAKVYFFALEEGTYTATLRLTDYATEAYEDVALSVVIVNQDTSTGIEDAQEGKVQGTKVFRNGQVMIVRNGETYTAAGIKVE